MEPPVVLFANIAAVSDLPPAEAVNGLLLPVEKEALAGLRRRELRYQLIDVSRRVEPYTEAEAKFKLEGHKALAFVGRDAFTRNEDVKRGVIPRSYMDTILRGVSFWERRFAGFESDFHASTIIPPGAEIASLERVDLSST